MSPRSRCQRRLLQIVQMALLSPRPFVGPRLKKLTFLAMWQALHLGSSQKKPTARAELLKKKAKRTKWTRPVLFGHDEFGAWANLVPLLRETDGLFFDFFHTSPATFDKLVALLSPCTDKVSWNKSISTGERLAITLRHLASGDSPGCLSGLFRVSTQAISKIIFETTSLIWLKLKKVVFPVLNEQLWMDTAANFDVRFGVTHCIGAVDAKQVPIKASAHRGSQLYTHKKRQCMTLMSVSDAEYRFLVFESGLGEENAKSNYLLRSNFSKKLGQLELLEPLPAENVNGDMPFFFVGDDSYSKSKHFATLYKESGLQIDEALYNYRLSRAHCTAENTFGIMCARFSILKSPLQGSASKVKSLILACVALHNLNLRNEENLPREKVLYNPYGFADYVDEDGVYVNGMWRTQYPPSTETVFKKMVCRRADVRDRRLVSSKGEELSMMLLEYFTSNPVPLQWHHLKTIMKTRGVKIPK